MCSGWALSAVVDGPLTAAALIEDCERITRYHTSITESAKEAVRTALRACHEANRERSRVIHGTWATRPGNVIVALQGSRRSHDVTVTVRTLAEVRQLADQLANAANDLSLVTCGERQVPNDLTVRFPGGSADPGEFITICLNGVVRRAGV